MNYSELARQQFYKLKEDTLDDDRHSLGAENEIDYNTDGLKFKIKVDGFWEESTCFDWYVYDLSGNLIESGTEY